MTALLQRVKQKPQARILSCGEDSSFLRSWEERDWDISRVDRGQEKRRFYGGEERKYLETHQDDKSSQWGEEESLCGLSSFLWLYTRLFLWVLFPLLLTVLLEVIIIPCYWYRNWGTQLWSDLAKVTQILTKLGFKARSSFLQRSPSTM